jgi:hypothetical protein
VPGNSGNHGLSTRALKLEGEGIGGGPFTACERADGATTAPRMTVARVATVLRKKTRVFISMPFR